MTINIELPVDLETSLRKEAEQRGIEFQDFLVQRLRAGAEPGPVRRLRSAPTGSGRSDISERFEEFLDEAFGGRRADS